MRGAGTVTFQPALGVGRLGDHLLALAEGERADVTVIGTHQRRGLARLGSVSGVILHYSHASVACVPEARDEILLPEDIPPMRRVLVPTDLSALANAAIPYGYALLPDGDGEVWLLHVLPAESGTTAPPEHAEIVARLRALVPPAALEKHIVTRLDVVQSADVARTIRDTAERLGADVICMASHGRAGLARTLLGSVAEAVMRQSRRPTLIIRAGLSE
jgi:nucleotide-binding universal stress UspA family protein